MKFENDLYKIIPRLLKEAGWSRFHLFLIISLTATAGIVLTEANSDRPINLSEPVVALIVLITALICYLFIWLFIKINIKD